MKLLYLLLFVFAISSCKKKGITDEPANDTVNPNAPVVAKGNFSGNANYTITGMAEIVDDNGQKRLVLSNFSASNGPDLRVYLSTNKQATSFVSLGKLKSLSGQQVYDISGMPNLSEFKFVLIWCQQFSVLFGSAEIN